MRIFAQKWTVWLWMAAVLTATVGVSVERLYCYCLGEARIALFTKVSDTCQDKNANTAHRAMACCDRRDQQQNSRGLTCCALVKGETPVGCDPLNKSNGDVSVPAWSDAGCVHKSCQYHQWQAEGLLDKQDSWKFDFPCWFKESPFFRHFTRPVLCQTTKSPRLTHAPPLSGRERCVLYHIYRC